MDGVEKQQQFANINDRLFGINIQNESLNKKVVEKPAAKNESTGDALKKLNLNDTNDLQVKRVAFLRARAYILLAQFNFVEAAKPLEEIASMQIPVDFDTNLLIVECFMQLGRESKANKAVDAVKNSILTSPCIDASEIVTLADDFAEVSIFIRAIILLRIAGTMYMQNSQSENHSLEGLYNCIIKTNKIVGGMLRAGERLRVVGIDYGIEYMKEMIECIRSLQNVHKEKKAVLIAWCVNYVGYNYGLAKENSKSVQVRKDGAEELERHFQSNATKYRVYGVLLHNIGVGLFNMSKFLDAHSFYLKAIDAKKVALDYDTEIDKKEDVELSEKDLADTLAKLTGT